MWGFIKKCFYTVITFFSSNVLNVNSLECVSMSNQECKARPKTINTNANEPFFYPFNVKANTFGGSCNNINDPYAKLWVPSVVKNINVKVFDLII